MHGLAALCVCVNTICLSMCTCMSLCLHTFPAHGWYACACMCSVSMCVHVCISHLPVSGPVTAGLHVYVRLCSGSTEVDMLGHV